MHEWYTRTVPLNRVPLNRPFVELGRNYFLRTLGEPLNNKSLYELDYELYESQEPQEILDKYYQKLVFYFIGEMNYDADYAKASANYYINILGDYLERRNEIIDLLKVYLDS